MDRGSIGHFQGNDIIPNGPVTADADFFHCPNAWNCMHSSELEPILWILSVLIH